MIVDLQKYRLGKQLNRDAHLHGSSKDGGKDSIAAPPCHTLRCSCVNSYLVGTGFVSEELLYE